MSEDISESRKFHLNMGFMRYEIDILVQIDRFTPYFFGESGRGGVNMDDLCSSGMNINPLQINKKIVPWFTSHKLIFNEIPWVESGIRSTVAPA